MNLDLYVFDIKYPFLLHYTSLALYDDKNGKHHSRDLVRPENS